MSASPALDSSEEFGRAVFDSAKALSAEKGKIHPKIFREKPKVRELSVDRVTLADLRALSELHQNERQGQRFWGWAVVTYDQACEMNRTVLPHAMPENFWHADIVLPIGSGDDAVDEQIAHSVNLAKFAKWMASLGQSPSADG